MESDVLSKTNGYCIFYGRESLDNLVKPVIDLMKYRKREKIVFYDGFSFKEVLEDIRPNGVISCCFPINKLNLSSTLIHGKIFNQKENQRRIKEGHDIIIKNGIEPNFSLDIDGDFSIAFVDKDYILALRSPISSKPLYFVGENKCFILSSDPYPLNLLGIRYNCLPSGHILYVKLGTRIETQIRKYYHMSTQDKTEEDLESAAKTLKLSLEYSVRENLKGIKQVGVAFSGGLDSSVLVKLIESLGITPLLITVCTKNSHDAIHAKKVADLLSLNHSILYVNSKSIEKRMINISKLFGKMNVMDFSIALVLNLVAEEAVRIGLEHVVVGQGADELFGGYQRYLNILRTNGALSLENALRVDFKELQSYRISRDEVAVSMFAEPVMPFINRKIVETAFSLPVEYKINRLKGDRKVILRSVAKELGLVEEIYLHPKKAMQYSSGIQKLLSKTTTKE